jgi:hypothetical protein
MALLKFNKGAAAGLINKQIAEGNIWITTDTQEMYVDVSAEKRIAISDFVMADSIDENGFLTIKGNKVTTDYYSNLFYYVVGSTVLRKFVQLGQIEKDGEQVDIVEWILIGDTTDLENAIAAVSAKVLTLESSVSNLTDELAITNNKVDEIDNIVNVTTEIPVTTAVGNYAKGSTIKLGDDGKLDLQELIINMLSKDSNPTVKTNPSITVTLTNGGAKEAGTKITPAFSISTTDGKYTANGKDQSANLTFGNYSTVEKSRPDSTADNKTESTSTNKSGSFAEFTVIDGTNYKVTSTADYSNSDTPKTYLGKDYPSIKIADGTATDDSGTITSYRNCFYGTLTTKSDLTSSVIRNLSD